LGPTEKVLPEVGDRLQYLKCCDLKHKQDGVLEKKNMTMDNVQKHNICRSDIYFDINEEKLVLLLERI
jgi:hypothetical protein